MNDIDFGALSQQLATTAGIMHHQTKLDVFIIRAYKLLSNGAVIHSNGALQSVSSSPQGSIKTPDGTPGGGGSSTGSVTTSSQYLQIFSKVSKLYNATISSGSIDDKSTSPKSPIELYQRFQQIIKELELSYDVSPYSKYFQRLDQGIWQIRDDAAMKGDKLWELASMSIYSIYDPRTGQMLSQSRRKANSMANSIPPSQKASPTEVRTAHRNPTVNSMMTDPSLPQQLQRKLQTISQDVNSRSLNGYYTQPTSPGHGNFNFGLGEGDTFYNNFNNNSSSWKRRSLGSLGADALDDEAVEELLQLTNTSKRQRTATPVYSGTDPATATANATAAAAAVATQPQQAVPITAPQTQQDLNEFAATPTTSAAAAAAASAPTAPPTAGSVASSNSPIVNGDALVRQLKNTYETLVSEKDQRIVALERELDLQRQETQWLRKMLIEDMGCVRSLLKDLRN
ncbi:GCR2 (YNL199C) [Zygosaccharomyces parabailii]|nr:GCR2 (YNL199C) [Zygosaccharomyces parabailii]